MKLCTIYIDGVGLQVQSNYDLWRACLLAGRPLPGFCWHNGLRAESCAGLCAVYCCREKRVKHSCSMRIVPGMYVSTKHEALSVVRTNILKFLIEKHPLECPVCPQNGACVLQDFSMRYPGACGQQITMPLIREDIHCGGFLQVAINRCVDCGLCTRFCEEVVGSQALVMGATPAGVRLKGLGYSDAPCVFSGNLSDLCPAGVFWDVGCCMGEHRRFAKYVESLDVHDSCGTPVHVVAEHNTVVGVKPRKNLDRYKWISDKARFSYDALSHNRLEVPVVRTRAQTLVFSWKKTIDTLALSLEKAGLEKTAVLVGPSVDLETLWVLRRLVHYCNIQHIDSHQRKMPQAFAHTSGLYTFGGPFERIFEADMIVLVGIRPVYEAPLLHTLLVQHYNKTQVPIVAMSGDFFMPYGENLGPNSLYLRQMMGESSAYQKGLENAQRPLFICGYDAFSGQHSDVVLNAVLSLAKRYTRAHKWNGVAFVPPHMSFVGCHDLGLCPKETHNLSGYGIAQYLQKGFLNAVLLLGYDTLQPSIFGNALCVYQGGNATDTARVAHIALSEAMHTEKTGLYVNGEGRVNVAYQATQPSDKVRDGVWIIQELLKRFDPDYHPCDRADITKECRNFYEQNLGLAGEKRVYMEAPTESATLPAETWGMSLQNFYTTDGMAQSSPHLQRIAHRVNWDRGKQGVW